MDLPGLHPLYMLACFGSLWLVIRPLSGMWKTLDFMMLTRSMSVKVKVPKELMRKASNYAHNEMNDTKRCKIG